MSGELIHTTAGRKLIQPEYESVTAHAFNSQATGDVLYASSATQLSRLAVGATNKVLVVIGGVPTWQSTLAGLTLTAPVITGLGTLNFGTETEITIASGTVAKTQTVHRIDTEADAATDDLDTVTGGTIGDLLIIRPANATRDVVVKAGSGTGTFRLKGTVDFTMDTAYDTLACIYSPNSEWQEIGRCEN